MGKYDLALVTYWGAVSSPQHPHVNFASPHPLGTCPRGRLISGRKISHVHDHLSCSGDRSLTSATYDCARGKSGSSEVWQTNRHLAPLPEPSALAERIIPPS